MAFSYPITLDLDGRLCVVVGGGDLAEDKVRGLLDAGAVVRVVAAEITAGLRGLRQEGRIQLMPRPYADGDLEGAVLAVGTAGTAENAAIYAEANRKGVLLNAVDDVEHCHWAAPSIVRRGDFTLSISTVGKAPALAKHLRKRLSERFGPEMGVLVDLLGQVRAEMIDQRAVGFDEWSRRWERALSHDLVGLVRSGRLERARRLVRASLRGQGACPKLGRVAIVGAGPGDPALITVRGKELLEAADVVVHDRLVHPSLVAGRNAIFAGKHAGKHCISQDEINRTLVSLAREGKEVVRLKGGDPLVFGRGSEEAEALARAGIDFEIVPAPTSAIAALAYAGIPVTDRRLSSSVAFVTGHCAGEREIDWERLATSVDTIVVLMGLGRLEHIVRELIAGGRPSESPAALVENGSLPEQRVLAGALKEIPEIASGERVVSPALLVSGEVVLLADHLQWYDPSAR